MSLDGIIRLIDRLKSDFGDEFIITLAPVATAMVHGLRHLSGFDYRALETARGSKISWYNVQFYNGWGQCCMRASTIPSYIKAGRRRGSL
ncbi:hypothetical protein CIHG_01005 [Coccidioides immitis H538.4]|uniref:Chitinase n=1 Tax=Coccidioides immitis H538.4 TaxID=396776 RepID=A0A0J8U862_COCIT|nr:hypothetical protein CIHG_01005 [Coccidioides immitis H538.4]